MTTTTRIPAAARIGQRCAGDPRPREHLRAPGRNAAAHDVRGLSEPPRLLRRPRRARRSGGLRRPAHPLGGPGRDQVAGRPGRPARARPRRTHRRGLHRRGASDRPDDGVRAHVPPGLLREARLHASRRDDAAAQGLGRMLPLPKVPTCNEIAMVRSRCEDSGASGSSNRAEIPEVIDTASHLRGQG